MYVHTKTFPILIFEVLKYFPHKTYIIRVFSLTRCQVNRSAYNGTDNDGLVV